MTRAVHLEIAHSLETDSFIMALRRMMARRGKPRNIYSDNGTNFVGAERELKECLDGMDQAKISDTLSQDRIPWFFNLLQLLIFCVVLGSLVKIFVVLARCPSLFCLDNLCHSGACELA